MKIQTLHTNVKVKNGYKVYHYIQLKGKIGTERVTLGFFIDINKLSIRLKENISSCNVPYMTRDRMYKYGIEQLSREMSTKIYNYLIDNYTTLVPLYNKTSSTIKNVKYKRKYDAICHKPVKVK